MPLIRTVSGACTAHDRLLLMRRIVTISRATTTTVAAVVVTIVRVFSGEAISGAWGVRGATTIVIVLSGRSSGSKGAGTLRWTWKQSFYWAVPIGFIQASVNVSTSAHRAGTARDWWRNSTIAIFADR